ncbi:MAG: carbohydrate porin [Phycisphaerales bacterium]|nr:carbohydrate porin [Phycisphaerales bacterium]
MKFIAPLAVVVIAGFSQFVQAQDDPGYGADDPTSKAIERQAHMHDKSTGLLMTFEEAEKAGVSERMMPSTTDRYPVVDHPVSTTPLFAEDPAQPLQNLFDSIRKNLTDQASLSFSPMAAWTYQHASEVVDGAPHAKSILWEAVSMGLTLWHKDGDYGQIIFVLQNNVGVGTPLLPYMGAGVGDPSVVNNILVGPKLTTNLYWQQSFNQDTIRLRVGKISGTAFFDRNAVAYDPISGFMALDFNQSLTDPFPSRGFGGVLSVDFGDEFTLRGGTMNSASTGTTSGFDSLGWAHLLTMLEGDQRIYPEIGGKIREGHLRLMAWYNAIPNPMGAGNIGGMGLTFNMDQAIADHATAFVRAGWGQNDVTVSNFAVSAGLAMTEPFGLKSCQTGIALEYAKITALGRQSANLAISPGEHYMLEWYWRVQMTKSTHTGPVIQVVRDVEAGISGSVILGWRTTIMF